jgi:hypothetical protein
MKYLALALLLPVISYAQENVSRQIKEQRKEDRAIADTMNFPDPFVFTYIDTISMNKATIYAKSCQWLFTTLGNTLKHAQTQDSLTGKIVVTDLEVAKYTTEVMTIDVKDGKYRIMFDNCKYDLKGAGYIPIFAIKDSKNTRLKKYMVVQSNNLIINSFEEYIRRKDDF